MEAELRSALENGKLQKVSIERLSSGKMSVMEVEAVFIFVGYLPYKKSVKCVVLLNYCTKIIADADMKTNLQGVFEGGDFIAKNIDK